jgi:very-short-patch-repair endonuclease
MLGPVIERAHKVAVIVAGYVPLADIAEMRLECLRRLESPAELHLLNELISASVQLVCWLSCSSVEIEPQHEVAQLGYRLDFLVSVGGRRIAVEADGFAYHSSQEAFQRDRERDRGLLAMGIQTFRFTAREIMTGQGVREKLFAILAELAAPSRPATYCP